MNTNMEEIIKTIKEFCPSDDDSCTKTVKKRNTFIYGRIQRFI